MSRYWPAFIVLASTQITGWGMVGLLPVTATVIASDLGSSLPFVFLGTTVMFVVMGLASPLVGPAAVRLGSRQVMAAGAAVIGAGLFLLGEATSVPVYLFSWVVIGVAGAMFLTTTAYIYLVDLAGKDARAIISALMLVTGLAGSVFWPLTAYLDGAFGWRTVAQIYAAVMTLGVCPLLLAALPRTSGTPAKETTSGKPPLRGRIFWLLVTSIALNSFVTFGMEAIGIELFRAMGAEMAYAVAIASLLGVVKVMGRAVDMVGGRRWSAVGTGVVAGALIPLGFLPLLALGLSPLSVAAFLILFGIGSGAFAVARATMPLVFYDKADYALAMSAIALPLNLASATSAPLLSTLMLGGGPQAVLGVLVVLAASALLVLLALSRSRSGSA